jgi:formate dehydrogenase subunit delta
MAEEYVDKLVRMANQIAANNSRWGSEEENVAKIQTHLNKFWTPKMRERLVTSDTDALDRLVSLALKGSE